MAKAIGRPAIPKFSSWLLLQAGWLQRSLHSPKSLSIVKYSSYIRNRSEIIMNIQSPNQKQPDPDGQPQIPPPRISPFWWILLIALMIWNVNTYLDVSTPAVEIPYSTFIEQVKAGNISQVTITGNEITGTFVKSLLWPPAMQDSTSANNAQATEQQDYSEFSTLFPDSVGDPKLLALLEEKNIEIQVQNVSTPW